MISDPHHSVVLQHVRLEGRADLIPRLKMYALLAPHWMAASGELGTGARSCGAQRAAGLEERVVAGDDGKLRILAHELRVVGASDGWQDLMQNFKMDWEFGSATDGNVAVMGRSTWNASAKKRQIAHEPRHCNEYRRSRRHGGARIYAGDRNWQWASHRAAKDDGSAGDAV